MLIKGYSDFSFEESGCSPGTLIFRAQFRFDADVSELFPYINAVGENATYYESPHHIQFDLEGFQCALYPDHAVARVFENRAQALGFINRLIDFLNGLYQRRGHIELDHRRVKPVPAFEIFKLLPRTNCRECGFITCMAFAAALGKGETAHDRCPGLTDPENENAARLFSRLFPYQGDNG